MAATAATAATIQPSEPSVRHLQHLENEASHGRGKQRIKNALEAMAKASAVRSSANLSKT